MKNSVNSASPPNSQDEEDNSNLKQAQMHNTRKNQEEEEEVGIRRSPHLLPVHQNDRALPPLSLRAWKKKKMTEESVQLMNRTDRSAREKKK